LTLKCTVGQVFIVDGALEDLCMYACMYNLSTLTQQDV